MKLPLITAQRRALELYRDGFEQCDIAEDIGWSNGTIKSWLTIADAVDPNYDDFIPIAQAAQLLHLSTATLGRWGKEGQANVITRNGKRVIPKTDVIKIRARRGGRGARKKIERNST